MIWFLVSSITIYLATFLLGLGIKRRWWRRRPARWLHHALFAAIWVSLGATALAGWWLGVQFWFAPLVVLLWMAPLPRFRPGGVAHQTLATGGLVTLVIVSVVISVG